MKTNTDNSVSGRKIYFNTYEERMTAYDALPPDLREIIRNAPLDVTTFPTSCPVKVKRNIVELMAKATFDTYGTDHPQVKTPNYF